MLEASLPCDRGAHRVRIDGLHMLPLLDDEVLAEHALAGLGAPTDRRAGHRGPPVCVVVAEAWDVLSTQAYGIEAGLAALVGREPAGAGDLTAMLQHLDRRLASLRRMAAATSPVPAYLEDDLLRSEARRLQAHLLLLPDAALRRLGAAAVAACASSDGVTVRTVALVHAFVHLAVRDACAAAGWTSSTTAHLVASPDDAGVRIGEGPASVAVDVTVGWLTDVWAMGDAADGDCLVLDVDGRSVRDPTG